VTAAWAPLAPSPSVQVRRLRLRGDRPLPLTLHVLSPPTGPELGPPTPAELRRLLLAVLETLSGRRPPTQLDPLLTDVDLRVLRNLTGPVSRHWTLRSVHPQLIGQAVELCASVEQNGRSRALAARLEPVGTRWRFATLRLL
jgi:hypothetical protein